MAQQLVHEYLDFSLVIVQQNTNIEALVASNKISKWPLIFVEQTQQDDRFDINNIAALNIVFEKGFPDWVKKFESIEQTELTANYCLATLQQLDKSILKDVFDCLVEQSRILGRYRTTFYYPFEFDGMPNKAHAFYLDTPVVSNESEDENELVRITKSKKELHSQAFLYYSPRVRKSFFKLKEQPTVNDDYDCLDEFQLPSDDIAISLRQEGERPELVGDIERLSLVQHGLSKTSFLLSFTVKPKEETRFLKLAQHYKIDLADYWQLYFHAYFDDILYRSLIKLQAAYWLTFTNQVRILYPTFIEQEAEKKIGEVAVTIGNDKYHTLKNGRTYQINGKDQLDIEQQSELFPEEVNFPVSEHILRLASLFFISIDNPAANGPVATQNDIVARLKKQCATQYDSRLYVNASYQLFNEHPKHVYALDKLKQFTALATMVDSYIQYNFTYDRGYCYNKEFMAQLIEQQWYTRWQGISGITGFNEYAVSNVSFGWFANNISYTHYTHHYHYMLIYVLLSREVLQHFVREMETATQKLTDTLENEKPSQTYREIKSRFIDFMNKYWFENLSHEQQGMEVFEKIKLATGIEKNYEQVKEKIAWADEYMESWRNIYFVDKADNTSIVAVILAVIAIVTAFPMVGPFDDYATFFRIGISFFAFAGILLVGSKFVHKGKLLKTNYARLDKLIESLTQRKRGVMAIVCLVLGSIFSYFHGY